jgi:hypothetical protein
VVDSARIALSRCPASPPQPNATFTSQGDSLDELAGAFRCFRVQRVSSTASPAAALDRPEDADAAFAVCLGELQAGTAKTLGADEALRQIDGRLAKLGAPEAQ